MKKLGKVFIQGLIAVLPVIVTLYILYWLLVSAESFLGGMIQFMLPERFYVPGMGVAAGLLIIFGVGVLLHVWLFRKLFERAEMLLGKLPLVKSLYGSIRDLMGFFDSSKKKKFNKVVMLTMGGADFRLLGFVTREDFSDLTDGIDAGGTIAVYLPMSYQMGGFTIFISKKSVQAIDMSIEEAMRFMLTAAVSVKKESSSEAS